MIYLATNFSHFFLCIVLVISLFYMTMKHIGDLPPSAIKHKKTKMCFTEKICMLDKLHSGIIITLLAMSLRLKKSAIYIKKLSLNRRTQNKVTYWSVDEHVATGGN